MPDIKLAVPKKDPTSKATRNLRSCAIGVNTAELPVSKVTIVVIATTARGGYICSVTCVRGGENSTSVMLVLPWLLRLRDAISWRRIYRSWITVASSRRCRQPMTRRHSVMPRLTSISAESTLRTRSDMPTWRSSLSTCNS